MITAITNVQHMSAANWAKGILRSLISGGAGAVSAGFGDFAVEAIHPTGHVASLGHTLSLMGASFLIAGLLRMMEFLQAHPIPDDAPANTPTQEPPK